MLRRLLLALLPLAVPCSELGSWLNSSNVADFLQLRPPPPLTVQQKLNLLFIGFHGEGEAGLNISEAQLSPWFQQLRAPLAHAHTAVRYTTRLRVLRLPPAVTARVEAFLHSQLRPEAMGEASGVLQADARGMSSLLASLLSSLELSGYTLFFMNPRRRLAAQQYGYRVGFSQSELEHMRSSHEVGRLLQSARRPAQSSRNAVGPGVGPSALDGAELTEPSTPAPAASEPRTAAEVHQRALEWAALAPPPEAREEAPLAQRGSEEALLARLAAALSAPSPPHAAPAAEEISRAMHGAADCLTDLWVSSQRLAFVDLSAGPFQWGPASGEGVRTLSSLPDLRRPAALRPHAADAPRAARGEGADRSELRAQRALLEAAARGACARLARGGDESEEARADCAAARAAAEAAAGGARAWGGPLYGAQPAGAAREGALLARLGGAAAALREALLAPPAARAPPYAARVAFQLFVVRAHAAPRADELEAFKRHVLRLRLPSQRFSFTSHALALHDDPALALAFAAARRTAAVPSPRGGPPRAALLVDSAELRAQLRRAAPPAPPPAAAHAQRTLPVFFFSSDEPLPLFLDAQLQARAVDDMVLAVASDLPAWEAAALCDRSLRTVNLRSPLRAALAATAELLGGLLPPHLAAPSADGRATHNWLWSVGESPLAFTSEGLDFGEQYAHLLHRHLVVGGLNASLAASRQVVASLRALPTSAASAGFLEDSLRLRSAFAKLGRSQARIAALVAREDVAQAALLLHSLHTESEALLRMARQAVDAYAPYRCASSEASWVWKVLTQSYLLPTLLVLTGLLALSKSVGVQFVKPRRKRPKVNVD